MQIYIYFWKKILKSPEKGFYKYVYKELLQLNDKKPK